MPRLKPLMQRNFLEYASYVIVDRAIPDLRDGLKPVQRRILFTLHAMDDGKFHKVANVIGETMKLHPHGDASIGEALTVLANKEYLIERQGNFGNLLTGHPPAAARYIECRLTDLARETLFHDDLTEWKDSYDGRRKEPDVLPARLPLILLLGVEGIAVGMSIRIFPHNLDECLAAQIAALRGETFTLLPDFPQGGLMDAREYADGAGKVRVRARIDTARDKTLVIRQIPYGTTTESLIASIESAVQKGKVKIGEVQDFTTDQVEIHVHLPRGVTAEETLPQLFAYTDCEVSLSSQLTVIDDKRPVDVSITEVVGRLARRLKDLLRAEIELDLARLEDRRHWLTLEQIFIEERVYAALERAKTEEALRKTVWEGMEKHATRFLAPMTDEDVTRLLEIRIRRISAYDVGRMGRQLEEIEKAIQVCRKKLRRMTHTAIRWLEDIRHRYGKLWPRRTQPTSFAEVDLREVARQNIKVTYDTKSGFWGSAVRGGENPMTLSEFDRVLLVAQNGSYRVVGPEEKVLIPGGLVHVEAFDEERGAWLTIVYRDENRIAWGKRVHIQRFVRGREVQLIRGRSGTIDLVLSGTGAGRVHLAFMPRKHQRLRETVVDLSQLGETGIGARGRRLAAKPVRRVRLLSSESVRANPPPPDR